MADTEKFKEEAFRQLVMLSDHVIVLEDGGKAPFNPHTLADEIIRLDGQPWNDFGNRLMLLARAAASGCDWVLWLDEDDVLSPEITKAAIQGMVSSCEVDGIIAVRFRVREMWNQTHWRIDGLFANKSRIVLQKNPLLLTSVTWKNPWNPHAMPVQEGLEFQSGWELFHWGMSTPELRAARVAKHEKSDPDRKWQADYSYIENSDGLELVKA